VFVSEHRRLTSRSGHGVQYLPGHVEPFVDLVLEEYLPDKGEILDLGGGGLRFALPVAATGRSITVVDLDPTVADLAMIVDRVNANDSSSLVAEQLASLIERQVGDGLEYLATTNRSFTLITAFRVIHLFSPRQIEEFFRVTYNALQPDGCLVVSGMTAFNLPITEELVLNEVFESSEPVDEAQRLYRRFSKDQRASEVRRAHNLAAETHLLDSEFVAHQAHESGFDVVVDSYQSTRIVAGFVLQKRA
jgi:SAM-dependent methyltransferase